MRASSKMRWRALAVAGLLAACGDSESRPEASRVPEPVVDEAPAEPTDRAAPDEASPAESEVSEPTAEAAPADPAPPPPVPEPPRPELKAALSLDAPEAVSIHATQAHRREEVVLYRVRAIEEWRARERAAGTLEASEARMDEAEARCEQQSAGNEGSLTSTSCYADMAPGAPEVGWERWGTRVYRLEVARVRWNPDRTEVAVVARRALFALSTEEDGSEDEVRVRDVDGDGEAEITVIAAVALPSNYAGETEEGRIGYVLAMSDLHTQFRTSRSFFSEMGDAGPNTLTVETTWRATDRDGDGHADLVVREQREHVDDDQPELPASRRAGTRTVECLWVAEDDTWRCPEQLGADLLERGAMP